MCKPRANDENTIKELKEDFALGGFSMKKLYAVEAAMVLRVLVYDLFLLFKHEFLGRKEKIQRLKTLRHKYFVLPARMGSDGRDTILRTSTQSRKAWPPVQPHQPMLSRRQFQLHCSWGRINR